MEESDRLRLRGNFRYVVGQVRVDDVRDYLYEKGVLDDDDYEELERRTPRNNTRKLLLILFKKGGNAYSAFCDALTEASYDHVVQKLKDTDPNSVTIENQDQLDSFLKEEGHIVELQRRLWAATEKLEHYQCQVERLSEQKEEDVKVYDDLQMKYTELEKEVECRDDSAPNDYMITWLEQYMSNASEDSVDSRIKLQSALELPTVPLASMLPKSPYTTTLVGRVALALSRDIVNVMISPPGQEPQLPNKYARTMRRTVMMLTAKQEDVFKEFIKKLALSNANGFEMIKGVADEMFREGENNWGRIVALYAFGGFVARHAASNKMDSIVKYIGDLLGMYVAKNLAGWIEKKGGWDDFERFFKESPASDFKWKGLFLTAIGFGALLSLASVKGSL